MGKLFSKMYDSFMFPLEQYALRDIRKSLISNASGIVLEIGSGTGANFPLYQKARKVFAIEPKENMLKQSRLRAQQAAVPVEVQLANAQNLPFAENTFDIVVCTLVLCTIPDPIQALNEVKRVCKPDGKILLLEHVRLDQPMLGSLQDMLTLVWKHLCDGCHLNRNPVKMLSDTGYKIVHCTPHFKNVFMEIEALNEK